MDADGERLRERSHFERGSIANPVDLLFGADEGLSEGAVNMRHAHGAPIEAHVQALVLAPYEAIFAGVAGQARADRDPIARLHPRHGSANLLDSRSHLMAENHRLTQAHGAKTTVVEVMEIGAADAPEANPHQNFVGANLGRGHLFDPQVLRGIGDDGAHGSDPWFATGEVGRKFLACDRTAGAGCRGRGLLNGSPGKSATGWPGKERGMRDIIQRLFSLDDAVALVTGSSGGIGLALARGLAEAGARVVVNGRDLGKVAAAVASMKSDGLLADAAVFDVTDPEGVERGVASIEHEIGPIYVLVNNAGIQRRSPLEDFSPETWRELMRTNLDAVFYVGQAVARRMIPRGKGQIINIASVQSELARTNIAPYTASKGAVKMLTKGMATDWGKHGLRANALAPGYFRTELNKALVEDEKFSAWLSARTPLGRWGDVQELVGAAIFLASDASSFVNGHVLYVDGGVTACL